MERHGVTSEILIRVLCVGLSSLMLWNSCEAEKACTTTSGKYGFCAPSLHSFFRHQDCDENENCYSFERSLNSAGADILRNLWSKCGKKHGIRIAGGVNAAMFEFPWIAMLYSTTAHMCAGTLITNRWVLTAAHCIKDELHAVHLGEYNLNTELDCPPVGRRRRNMCTKTKKFAIDTVIKHPDYNVATLTMDIALIKLNETVEFDKSIAPICLPVYQSYVDVPVGSNMTIIGWGLTETGFQSAVLQKAFIMFEPLELCIEMYKRTRITKAHLCVRGDPNVSSCQGDSGGPLLRSVESVGNGNRGGERYVQAGVISHGAPKCGNAPFAYPYASVVNAMPWITSTID